MQKRTDDTAHIHRPQWFFAGLIVLAITGFVSQTLQFRLGQAQPMPTLWVIGTLVMLFCLVRSAQSPTTARQTCPQPCETGRHE